MSDVPLEEKLTNSWSAVLPVEERKWNAGLLTAVGLSSPPAWLRPYKTLSNGEVFRASMARPLAEYDGLVVVDEFTSVVDRQVAKVASHAVAKAVRRSGRQLVAVTCHYDVLDRLQPDWVYDVAAASFAWRQVQPRPTLALEVRAADRSLWQVFRHHHYLSAEISNTAHCFVGCIDGAPVSFLAYRHFQHPRVRNMKMEHRLVVLPDFQGLSIGARMSEWVAQHLADQGYRYRSVSSHPALISYRDRSPRWQRQVRATKLRTSSKRRNQHKDTLDPRRLGLVSFEYIPPAPPRRVR